MIARQFFPRDPVFRAGLPKVPSCPACNRAKQRVEDTAAVTLQFGHASDASRQVLTQRVPRTLRRNSRLLRALRDGLRRAWVRQPSGLAIPGLVVKLNRRVLGDLRRWYEFIAKGLYRFELGVPLPSVHLLYLVKPATVEQFQVFHHRILACDRSQRRSFANGEFRYLYGLVKEEEVSLWLIIFKSVEVVAVTLGPDAPDDLRRKMEQFAWTSP